MKLSDKEIEDFGNMMATKEGRKTGCIAFIIVLIVFIFIAYSCVNMFKIESLSPAEKAASRREDRRLIEEHRKTKQLHKDLHYLYGDEIYDK